MVAAQQGLTPIDVLLSVMRQQYETGMEPTKRKYKGKPRPPDWDMLEKATRTAAIAAPYVHPRLSAVEVLKGTNDGDLNAIIMSAGIEAGVPPELLQTLVQGPDGTFEPQQQEPQAAEPVFIKTRRGNGVGNGP